MSRMLTIFAVAALSALVAFVAGLHVGLSAHPTPANAVTKTADRLPIERNVP